MTATIDFIKTLESYGARVDYTNGIFKIGYMIDTSWDFDNDEPKNILWITEFDRFAKIKKVFDFIKGQVNLPAENIICQYDNWHEEGEVWLRIIFDGQYLK
jgi:hypothetical protein